MASNGKLMDMLTGYAASHQHPVNIFVHMIGIPTIMFGVLIPLGWFGLSVAGMELTLSHAVVAGLFQFYLTLDKLFAVVFLVFALLIAILAGTVGEQPLPVSGGIAAAAFFGGYAAQFIGHAIEKSMPVLVKHPVQANLAAPFFDRCGNVQDPRSSGRTFRTGPETGCATQGRADVLLSP